MHDNAYIGGRFLWTKSLVKPVTWQKTCNYMKLFGSFTGDRRAQWRIYRRTFRNALCKSGRTEQLDIFCHVTGFMSDFLSFVVVELLPFFHGAIQLLLFCACVRAWLHDFHPSCSLSFSTVLLHVVFGLPTLSVPSGVHVRAVAQWLLWSILSTCPIQIHLLCRTTSLLFSNSSLEMTYGQCTL